MKSTMRRIMGGRGAIAAWLLLGGVAGAVAQDVLLQRLPFMHVVAEDQKVRVLHYAAPAGSASAMHSHPETVVVVLKGGRVRYTLPDGSQKVVELRAGEAMVRPPVTHRDETIDPVEAFLVEIKN